LLRQNLGDDLLLADIRDAKRDSVNVNLEALQNFVDEMVGEHEEHYVHEGGDVGHTVVLEVLANVQANNQSYEEVDCVHDQVASEHRLVHDEHT
jgi:hypothetical protein